jgi:uncharacterized Zn finger protein
MMRKPPDLSESLVRRNASAEVVRRGEEYLRRGAVSNAVRRGGVLSAHVEGSDDEPYRVTVTLGRSDVDAADCTCPYEWEGWCKHIVAVLLLVLRAPDQVEEAPAVETLLDALDKDSLRRVLLGLIALHPDLADDLAALVTPAVLTKAAALPLPDTARIRQQVRAAVRSLDDESSSNAYWQVGAVARSVQKVADQETATRLRAGDGRGALAALEAVTQTYVKSWTELDDSDGDASGLFYDLAPSWTEALLTALAANDLAPAERKGWERKLAAWQRDLEEYGVDDVFAPAIAAAKSGWDDPGLARILRAGGDGPGLFWSENDDLVRARLNVLERQNRLEEALRLARAAGQDVSAVLLLVALGRGEEALRWSRERLSRPADVLLLAERLHAAGDLPAALRAGEHGLDLPRTPLEDDGVDQGRHALADWLRERADECGETLLAGRAARVAFGERPDLSGWRDLQRRAGDEWPALRADLLVPVQAAANRFGTRDGAVEILLHEGLTNDALAAAKRSGDYRLLARVADAAAPLLPDKVLPLCRAEAEAIMDAGKSSLYEAAAGWLARARVCYHALNRAGEWRVYRDGLIEKHKRKYALIPRLRALPD